MAEVRATAARGVPIALIAGHGRSCFLSRKRTNRHVVEADGCVRRRPHCTDAHERRDHRGQRLAPGSASIS